MPECRLKSLYLHSVDRLPLFLSLSACSDKFLKVAQLPVLVKLVHLSLLDLAPGAFVRLYRRILTLPPPQVPIQLLPNVRKPGCALQALTDRGGPIYRSYKPNGRPQLSGREAPKGGGKGRGLFR